MRLFVKEKVISLHNRYFIYNENQEQEYEIESKIISLGDKTTIYDKNHNIVAYIAQNQFHFIPKYDVYINNQLQFSIQRKLKLFEIKYILSNNYKVEGDLFALSVVIKNSNDEKIAFINRDLISIGDKYCIEILNENELPIILSIIVSITNDIDRAQRHRH